MIREEKSRSNKNSPDKKQMQMKQIKPNSSRKMLRDKNDIQVTKNQQDGQGLPVFSQPKEQQTQGEATCHKCAYQGRMNQQYKMGCVSWSWFSCLLVFTVVLSPIPFFCQSCKDKLKYCPICGETVDRQFARCL